MAIVTLPEPGRPFVTIQPDGEAGWRDLDAGEMFALYREHGALLLRGFATDLAAFHAFTAQYCVTSVFNESPDRKLLDDGNNIQSVNLGSDPFPLHPELSREPWKPDVAFFYCIQPPKAQGQTTLCDGVALAAALPEEIRDGLAGRRLVYSQPAGMALLEFWLGTSTPSDTQLANPPAECPYRFERVGETIVRSFTRPALHQPMFSDAPAFGNFLLFARYYLNLRGFPALDDGAAVPEAWLDAIEAIGERLSVPVGWQAGDLVMLDNSRFLHGRTAITDPDARLIATHFGYLKQAGAQPEEPADPIWRRHTFRPPPQGRAAA